MTQTVTKKLLVLLLLVTSLISSAGRSDAETSFQSQEQPPAIASAGRDAFVRTELFFGTAREDLPPVTDEDWRAFLDAVITEKFPDGLTVLTADGQFKNKSGEVIREKSFVVILLYPVQRWKKSNHSIEEIRKLYTAAFQQESVLRMDYLVPVRVSF